MRVAMKKPLLTLSAAALALMLSACGETSPEERMDRAEQAFAENRFNDARIDLASVLQDDANNREALELLAQTQLQLGQSRDVLSTVERLRDSGGLSPELTLIAAEAHLQLGDTDEVRRMLARDQSAPAWRLLALAATFDGEIEAAMDAFAAGREAPGDRLELHVSEAEFHLTMSDAEAAREAVARAEAIDRAALGVIYVSARLAQLDGDNAAAAEAYERILAISPLDRPALLGAIAERGNAGDIDGLRPLVERGREAYPFDVEFLYLDARLAAHEEDWRGVRELLQANESLIADHPDARGLYGEALLELGQAQQARAQLAPIYRRNADNPNIARAYARTLIETGDHAEAARVIAPFANSADAEEIDRQIAQRAANG